MSAETPPPLIASELGRWLDEERIQLTGNEAPAIYSEAKVSEKMPENPNGFIALFVDPANFAIYRNARLLPDDVLDLSEAEVLTSGGDVPSEGEIAVLIPTVKILRKNA